MELNRRGLFFRNISGRNFYWGGLQLLRTLKLRLCRGDNESRVWLTPYTGMQGEYSAVDTLYWNAG